MTETNKLGPLNRILVALDASRSSVSALETAAALAEAMQCELSGLFVEDSDLLTLASLPFSHEVSATGGAIRKLDPSDLEKEIQSRIAAARRAMQRIAGRRRLQWNFRCVRGNVHSELTAAATGVDILCIGRQTQQGFRKSRPHSTVQMALHGQAPVLIANDLTNYLNGPVAVIFDDSPGAENCARLGIEIARNTRNELVVLLRGGKENGIAAARSRFNELPRPGLTPRFVTFDPSDASNPPQTVHANQFGLVICGVKTGQPTPAWLDYLVNVVGCPLLLVPEPGG